MRETEFIKPSVVHISSGLHPLQESTTTFLTAPVYLQEKIWY